MNNFGLILLNHITCTKLGILLFEVDTAYSDYNPQMYKGDPRTCAILIPAWGSNWGYLGFPVIKITVVRQVRMSPTSTAV